MADGRLSNVERLQRELEDLQLAPGSLDAVFLIKFYHDTYWMKVDRVAMNRGILAALKPGGVYVVIDHEARAGSGGAVAKSLHRVEGALVEKEILSIGFRLKVNSSLLRRARDDHSRSAFELSGKTDRFVLIFQKPNARKPNAKRP